MPKINGVVHVIAKYQQDIIMVRVRIVKGKGTLISHRHVYTRTFPFV